MSASRGARTPHRDALQRAWTAAEQVEHQDSLGNYESRDFYMKVATMWATIALAERGGAGGVVTAAALNARPPQGV